MKVFLTGASGFIGKHCLSYLLARGHSVVAAVRSDAKGRSLLQDHAGSADKLSYSVVGDMTRKGAFDEAVQADPPFQAVIHMASPFHYHATDLKKDMIEPAVAGTMEILRAVAKHAPTVERIVITSSFAAVINMQEFVPVYTSDNWNPITVEQALSNGQLAYVGSKKLAEKAAWDFVESEKPSFTLATINPVMVFGPPIQPLKSLEDVNTSNSIFSDILLCKMRDGVPDNSFQWVDVRDVALAHVRAMEVPEAAGKRFLASAGPYSNAEIAQIVKEKLPDLADRLPSSINVPTASPSFVIDATPMKQILGISFRKLEDSVVDTVKSLMETAK